MEHAAEPIDVAAGHRRWLRTDRVLAVIAIAVLMWLVGDVLFMVFAGILVAVALDGGAQHVAKATRLRRGWALVLVLMVMLAAGILGVVAIAEPLAAEVRQIWRALPAHVDRATAMLWQYLGIDADLGGRDARNGLARKLAERAAPASAAALDVLIGIVVVGAVGLFLAINPDLYRRGLVRLFPAHRRARLLEVLSAAGHGLRWWLVGQMCSMAILGTVTAVSLRLLGVPLWLGLGMLTAVFTFVPYFGPLIAAVPVLLMSFGQGFETGLTMFAIYVVLQNVEGWLMTPAIQQRAVRLPPAVLISAQVGLAAIFGVPGLLLAAPFTVVAMVLVKELYVHDVLGEPR